jgi:hypothetical protein
LRALRPLWSEFFNSKEREGCGMKRTALVFSVLVFLLSLGISVQAEKLVHLQREYIGEDDPKNQIWIATTEKQYIDHNMLCLPKEAGAKVAKYKACAVKYFTTTSARKPFLLKYKRENKKFYLADEKKPYDSQAATDSALANKKYATYGALEQTRRSYGSYPAIWVMDPTGRLYVSSTPQPGIFNHSSFLGGGSVICAGEIIIIEGKITFINNGSGHYKPPDEALINAIDKLREQGVQLDPALVLQYMGAKHQQSLKDHDDGIPIGYSAPP